MTQTINVKEVTTLQADRQFYQDQGYSYEDAEMRAYDHLFAVKNKKFKEL